ncbi:MAG: hypothetical protein ACRDX8_06775 [Acidimicrobiales bacterium]
MTPTCRARCPGSADPRHNASSQPGLLVARTRAAQAELASAKAVIDAYEPPRPSQLGRVHVYGLLAIVGGLTGLLAEANTQESQRVYRSAGVHLRYERTGVGKKVTACLRVGLSRVGGGT